MAIDENYLSYLAHKIAKLEKEIERIKEILQSSGKGAVGKEILQTPAVAVAGSAEARRVEAPKVQDPVIEILKEMGPLNIVDINNALKARGINEDIRSTLFNRVKRLLEAGLIEYDEATQTFRIRQQS